MSTIVQPAPRSVGRRVGRIALDWIPALAVFVLGIAAWQGLVAAFHVQEFLLPKPTSIAHAFWDQKSALWSQGIYTFKEALGGYALGCGLGILVALLFAAWRTLSSAFMPYAVAANAIPIIAFAPIMNNWFGLLNPFSKMAIAAVLCFFPVMINTLRGLTSVHPSSIELMRSYAAGRVSLFRASNPTSLPYVFTASKVASVLAMIGAIVGEYFWLQQQLDPDQELCSAVPVRDAPGQRSVACILGIAFYLAVRWPNARCDGTHRPNARRGGRVGKCTTNEEGV